MRQSPLARSQSRTARRGLAATELAVCLPILVLLVLATIEACTMIFLKQSLTVSAYEGTRAALTEGAVLTDVEQACQAVLRDRRVQGGAVAVTPPNFDALRPGEYLTVTVTAPTNSNSILPNTFYRGRVFSTSATMLKEF